MRTRILSLLLACVAPAVVMAQDTFSIVAIDPATGEIGSAGATCLSIEPLQQYISSVVPGRGAIHAQGQVSIPNRQYALSLMLKGESPQAILDSLMIHDDLSMPYRRQYLIIDTAGGGRGVGFSGDSCFDYKGHIVGKTYVIAGNILSDREVILAMESRFNAATGTLGDRLMAALQGANTVGADARCAVFGTSSLSAFIRVARPADQADAPWLDLHVMIDEEPAAEPIDSLQRVYDAWKSTGAVAPAEGSLAPRRAPGVRAAGRSGSDVMIELVGAARGEAWTLEVFDVAGNRLAMLDFRGEGGPEGHRVAIPAGSYLYRLAGNVSTGTGKLMVE